MEFVFDFNKAKFDLQRKTMLTDIPHMPKIERNSGEVIFKLLKLDFSVMEIEDMLDIKPITIDSRVIEYLKQKGDTFEDFDFLTQKVKDLPITGMTYKFCKSNQTIDGFCKSYAIGTETFKYRLKKLENISYFNNLLKEKKEKTV